MNTPRDSLSGTLHAWRVAPTADPNFRQVVWQRIGKQAGDTWPTYLRAHIVACSMAAAVAISAAAATGSALAHSQARADREAIVVTYLVDLDPRAQAVLKP